MNLPYYLSHFMKKNPLFDVDLFFSDLWHGIAHMYSPLIQSEYIFVSYVILGNIFFKPRGSWGWEMGKARKNWIFEHQPLIIAEIRSSWHHVIHSSWWPSAWRKPPALPEGRVCMSNFGELCRTQNCLILPAIEWKFWKALYLRSWSVVYNAGDISVVTLAFKDA